MFETIFIYNRRKNSSSLKTRPCVSDGPEKEKPSGSIPENGNCLDQVTLVTTAVIMVGAERFELPTSCSQSRRATRLRYAPLNYQTQAY